MIVVVRRSFRPRPVVVAVLMALAVAALPACTALAQAEPPMGAVPDAPAAPAAKPELTGELMYRILVGDVALQRGEPAVAARAYYEAARDAKDARLARRATEIALAARQRGLAVEAARLWSELEPDAERPKQVIASFGSGSAQRNGESAESELKAQIEKALAQAAGSPPSLAEAFLQLNHLLGQEPDKSATYKLISALAQPYPNIAEAQFAVALAAYNAGIDDMTMRSAAMRAVERALALKPGWERAVALKAEILGKESPDQAIAYLEEVLKAEPGSRPLRGALAQLYVEQKRFADARAQFERLWTSDKSAREFEFAMAVISIQMKDWKEAEKLLQDLQQAGYGENAIVEYYLAQVAEESGRYDVAIERYKAMPEGERAWLAQLRIATIMAKQKRLDDARAYLRALPVVTLEQKVQVRQAEAQLLRDAGDDAQAYALLAAGLKEHPDSTELLYDTAMVAEKLDKIDVAEANLRRVIEIAPDNAQALNALGYTLVDRTPRVEEGYVLIEKALKLSPGDPFIMDSMGWALFRLGRLDEAEKYLRRAMAERPDAEIAAHLGEVLWAKGDRAAAQEIWQSQLKATPDNAVLQDTVRRLAR